MEVILQGYDVNRPTWFYLSLLLIVAVFFKFNRLWSLRNLDLSLLLSLAPGLLIIQADDPKTLPLGYGWMFLVTGLLLLRLFVDGAFTRRPRLEQNLNAAGMAFLCGAAFLFQTTKIMTEPPHESTLATVLRADQLLNRQDKTQESVHNASEAASEAGPATSLLATTVVPFSGGVADAGARLMAILAHAAVVLGLIFVGRWHFSDTTLGLAMATLYLLLPCTAYDVTRVNSLLPAALILWAVACYRKPIVAGLLLGLACGSMFFAVFLLPLWTAFYWKRGAMRFASALVGTAVVVVASLLLTSADSHSFTRQIIGSIEWSALKFQAGETGVGFWSTVDPAWRIPVFATFLVMLTALSIWPLQKSVEQLLSHSTAIIVGTQFWYPQHGGIYVLWYLPLMLTVVFRPRLAHLIPTPPPAQTLIATHDEASRRESWNIVITRWRIFR